MQRQEQVQHWEQRGATRYRLVRSDHDRRQLVVWCWHLTRMVWHVLHLSKVNTMNKRCHASAHRVVVVGVGVASQVDHPEAVILERVLTAQIRRRTQAGCR